MVTSEGTPALRRNTTGVLVSCCGILGEYSPFFLKIIYNVNISFIMKKYVMLLGQKGKWQSLPLKSS